MPTFVIPADYCVALVDLGAYSSFVKSNWTLDLLLDHLLTEMNTGHILAWGTGASANWRIEVSTEKTGRTGFREFSGRLRGSGKLLHLTSYEELTFAAQFRTCRLPRPGTEDWRVEVESAKLDCRVVQLYDPELAETPEVFEQEAPHFLIELTPTRTRRANRFDAVPWFQDG